MSSQPFSKVTVVVDTPGEPLTTYRFHKAMDVEWITDKGVNLFDTKLDTMIKFTAIRNDDGFYMTCTSTERRPTIEGVH